MNLNKLTEKAREALLAAKELAEQLNHSQIDPEKTDRSHVVL